MTPEQFVSDLQAMNRLTVSGLIEQMIEPEGRQPPEELLQLSLWYHRQTDEDQELLALALRRAAEGALFTVFCALDGILTLPSADSGSLELHYVEEGRRVPLNDPEGDYLSDLMTLGEVSG